MSVQNQHRQIFYLDMPVHWISVFTWTLKTAPPMTANMLPEQQNIEIFLPSFKLWLLFFASLCLSQPVTLGYLWCWQVVAFSLPKYVLFLSVVLGMGLLNQAVLLRAFCFILKTSFLLMWEKCVTNSYLAQHFSLPIGVETWVEPDRRQEDALFLECSKPNKW